eukprot:TRINITY_DN122327_c0_g1_i1.p1 TRINITY_DN122327_c0_g1~~TRINITY_DN122327_c0_g1_i1.p1  ORF type:complete len:159 (-),score=13.18 TRINITY_DN122327_c0_g1_i1:102-578(-)
MRNEEVNLQLTLSKLDEQVGQSLTSDAMGNNTTARKHLKYSLKCLQNLAALGDRDSQYPIGEKLAQSPQVWSVVMRVLQNGDQEWVILVTDFIAQLIINTNFSEGVYKIVSQRLIQLPNLLAFLKDGLTSVNLQNQLSIVNFFDFVGVRKKRLFFYFR